MSYSLGVDTGGTYTDAVLLHGDKTVIASAKALTTHEDLAVGIGEAVRAVLARAGVAPGDVSMAALSTTLATNALVEGQGGRVALIYIGFRAGDIERPDLAAALSGDPALHLAGGHTHAGTEALPLDSNGLTDFLDRHGPGLSGYAVASQFATRNPAHELEVARQILSRTGSAVTCSHQLSARLNGPKRAVTAVLNARLVGMVDRLIGRAQDMLCNIGVQAPLMVVRGDGALISAQQARSAPIETILSGPAASTVGARWLTGADTALVSDIGGTTTDVALLRNGRPKIDPDGARVGGFRTMVEAVAMRTTGLGGDSEVHVRSAGLEGGVILGPRRVLPISLIAAEAADIVHPALDRALRADVTGEMDARFVRAVPGLPTDGLTPREAELCDRIGVEIQPLIAVLRNRMDHAALARLLERGLVQVAGITPSDASHALGWLDAWDRGAADKALRLLARKRTGSGEVLAPNALAMARMIVDRLTLQNRQALLETVFHEEGGLFDGSPAELADHSLLHRGLAGHRGLLRIEAGLNVPVIGLGASARSYYPAVGKSLNAELILPEHAAVANAIGAVVGHILMRRSGVVTSPSEGRYRAHMPQGPEDFDDPAAAMAHLEEHLRDVAREAAVEAGAADIHVTVSRDVRTAQAEAREIFVEAHLTVEASGRPRFAV